MAIQQVMSDSPITGWIWMPGAGENGGTSDRRTQVAPFADLESTPASLTSAVPDIFPLLPPCNSDPATGEAHSRHVRSHCRRCWQTAGTRRNQDERFSRFERTFLTVRGSTPRL